MMIETIGGKTRRLAAIAAVLGFVLFGGCGPTQPPRTKVESKKFVSVAKDEKQRVQPPATTASVQSPEAETKPAAKAKSSEKDLSEELERVEEKPRDLGPPLVDSVDALTHLDPKQPVWIDGKNKQVVLQGETCRAGYPLEFFATYSNRSYEAVLAVNVTPSFVHAALLRVGAVPGHPAQFKPMKAGDVAPEIVPASGTEIAIELRWNDKSGKRQSARAQDWVRDRKTKKALESNWVFAGSMFVKDEETGKEYYQADSGELICVLSLPTALLDLPMRSYGKIEERSFEAFAERLPSPGTPVTLVLKPLLSTAPVESKPAEKPAVPAAKMPTEEIPADVEKAALESANAWLALVDQGEYARGWDTAAEYLKQVNQRKDFIQLLNTARKPLGALKSRELESKRYTHSLPGAPDGRYVVFQFKSSFDRKATAVETVTPMLDKDKKWRVSGYYIK